MSLYPIISKYDINWDLIEIGDPKIKSSTTKQITNNSKGHILIERIHNYYYYSINYKYDRLGINQFCLMTPFLKIVRCPIYNKSHFELYVDVCKNLKLKELITNMLEKLKSKILKLNPKILPNNISFPIKELANKQYIILNLQDFDNKVTTPIHYHQTKKQGGNIITIVNETKQEFINKLSKEATMFKYKSYGKSKNDYIIKNNNIKKNDDDKKNDFPEMYYEGKFTLFFSVTYSEQLNSNPDIPIHCKIKIFAKEAEIKLNLTYAKSVLDVDVHDINKINTTQPNILAI